MLDLSYIAERAAGLSVQGDVERLEEALRRFQTIDTAVLLARIRAARGRIAWLVPDGMQASLQDIGPLPEPPAGYAALAADASSIWPDRHSPALYLVLQVSRVALPYGLGVRGGISSHTSFFAGEELTVPREISPRQRPLAGTLLEAKRAALELRALAELACAHNDSRPLLALFDGSLILWGLIGEAEEGIRRWLLDEFLQGLEALRNKSVPVVGYVSFPSGREVLNALRVDICPWPSPDCDRCFRSLKDMAAPCDAFSGILDRWLFEQVLEEGERSALFRSSHAILEYYGAHHIWFTYLNTGQEIARLEMPEWVALETEKRDLVQALVYDQCQRGQGYPPALQEAHEAAAISPADRKAVERLMEEALARQGILYQRSQKDTSKRRRGV